MLFSDRNDNDYIFELRFVRMMKLGLLSAILPDYTFEQVVDVAAGAGLIGVYPQQKIEEYFSHKKIKKEYKKYYGSLISDFTMPPMSQKDLIIFVPIENTNCVINVNNRIDRDDIYSDYHQL